MFSSLSWLVLLLLLSLPLVVMLHMTRDIFKRRQWILYLFFYFLFIPSKHSSSGKIGLAVVASMTLLFNCLYTILLLFFHVSLRFPLMQTDNLILFLFNFSCYSSDIWVERWLWQSTTLNQYNFRLNFKYLFPIFFFCGLFSYISDEFLWYVHLLIVCKLNFNETSMMKEKRKLMWLKIN